MQFHSVLGHMGYCWQGSTKAVKCSNFGVKTKKITPDWCSTSPKNFHNSTHCECFCIHQSLLSILSLLQRSKRFQTFCTSFPALLKMCRSHHYCWCDIEALRALQWLLNELLFSSVDRKDEGCLLTRFLQHGRSTGASDRSVQSMLRHAGKASCTCNCLPLSFSCLSLSLLH